MAITNRMRDAKALRATRLGIKDLNRKYGILDLAKGDVTPAFITPAGELRPKSVPCGPRSSSTCSMSNTGKPLRAMLSCTTSS